VRILFCIWTILAAALCLNDARAFPDGAPWGAANHSAPDNCTSCHFDSEATRDSRILHIEGLPEDPVPGETYDLIIRFDNTDAATVGFQLIAQAEDDQAGTFVSAAADVETVGAAIRSTSPKKSNGAVSWTLQWHAPKVFSVPIVFDVAASAANDDGSPLGDKIHFRSYSLPATRQKPDD